MTYQLEIWVHLRSCGYSIDKPLALSELWYSTLTYFKIPCQIFFVFKFEVFNPKWLCLEQQNDLFNFFDICMIDHKTCDQTLMCQSQLKSNHHRSHQTIYYVVAIGINNTCRTAISYRKQDWELYFLARGTDLWYHSIWFVGIVGPPRVWRQCWTMQICWAIFPLPAQCLERGKIITLSLVFYWKDVKQAYSLINYCYTDAVKDKTRHLYCRLMDKQNNPSCIYSRTYLCMT